MRETSAGVGPLCFLRSTEFSEVQSTQPSTRTF